MPSPIKKPSLLELSPTQFVLGMKEIEFKVAKIKSLSAKALQKYCDEHVIPLVLGPRNQTFLIDHHHFARACFETNVDQYSVKVIKDLRDLDHKSFWNLMIKNNWTYLRDQFGLGPHSPYSLPADIRGLADDPYRSLSWAVLAAGGFKKMDVPFFEFQWSAFYRQNMDIVVRSKSDFKDAIQEAMKLSKSKDASHLPGYK
jgi:hypothetical protein